MKNRSCETLEMGAGKSSVSCTFNSNRHCGDYIARSRASVRITRSLLGCNCHPCRNAINARCDTSNFGRTHCRYRSGCSRWSVPGDLVSRKSFLSSRPRYLCWDFCALHFAWRKLRSVTRASPLESSCSFRVRTAHGSLRFIASSKSQWESLSPWHSSPSGRSIRPNPRKEAPSR